MEYENIKLGLASEADRIIILTEKYLSAIPKSSQTFFGVSEEEIKKAHSQYRHYTTSLISRIDKADALAASLSSLVCLSDLEMNNEETMRASLLFDEYCRWKRSMSDFMTATDLLFTKKKDEFRYSTLIATAQKFYESTKFMKGMMI